MRELSEKELKHVAGGQGQPNTQNPPTSINNNNNNNNTNNDNNPPNTAP
jgi:bacteriocin-like protein